MPSQHFQHTAYTLLANPFVHTRNSPSAPLMNGPVAARDVLRLHLQQLGATFSDLAAILLVMPQSPGPQPTEEVPGYRNVTELDIGYVGPTARGDCRQQYARLLWPLPARVRGDARPLRLLHLLRG